MNVHDDEERFDTHRHLLAAKHLIFSAQDGIEDIPDRAVRLACHEALAQIRSRMEALDNVLEQHRYAQRRKEERHA